VAEQLSGHARQQHAKVALLKLPVLILSSSQGAVDQRSQGGGGFNFAALAPYQRAGERLTRADQAALCGLYRDGPLAALSTCVYRKPYPGLSNDRIG
jgi:hypothetical protein